MDARELETVVAGSWLDTLALLARGAQSYDDIDCVDFTRLMKMRHLGLVKFGRARDTYELTEKGISVLRGCGVGWMLDPV